MRTLLRARYLVFLALLFAILFAIPVVSHAQVGVGVAITVAPPALPVYEQPPCPTEGFLWTPGYWATAPEATSGFRARGLRLRIRVCCGRRATGGSREAPTVGMEAIGDLTSDSMAELIMASGTAA